MCFENPDIWLHETTSGRPDTNTDLQVPNLPLTANLNLDVAARGHRDPGVILCGSYRSRVPLQQTYLTGVTNPLDRAAVISPPPKACRLREYPATDKGMGSSQPTLCINTTFTGALDEFSLFGASHSTSKLLKPSQVWRQQSWRSSDGRVTFPVLGAGRVQVH